MSGEALNIGLIGAGAIGWPQARPLGEKVTTHADAVFLEPDCHLTAVVEPDTDNAIWNNSYGIPVYKGLNDALDSENFDAFIVATPTSTRPEILETLLSCNIGGVVAEKPISCSGKQSVELVNRYRQESIPFWVNLSRRYVSVYSELARNFRSNEEVISARISYAKGIKHNGIHALDLAMMLFGNLHHWQVLGKRFDYANDDPTLSLFAQLEYCPQLFLQGLDHRLVTHFEVDIWTTAGRYVIDQDHTRLRRYEYSPRHNQDENKLSIVETSTIAHNESFSNLLRDLKDVLTYGGDPRVLPEEVAKVEILIDEIMSTSGANNC